MNSSIKGKQKDNQMALNTNTLIVSPHISPHYTTCMHTQTPEARQGYRTTLLRNQHCFTATELVEHSADPLSHPTMRGTQKLWGSDAP